MLPFTNVIIGSSSTEVVVFSLSAISTRNLFRAGTQLLETAAVAAAVSGGGGGSEEIEDVANGGSTSHSKRMVPLVMLLCLCSDIGWW